MVTKLLKNKIVKLQALVMHLFLTLHELLITVNKLKHLALHSNLLLSAMEFTGTHTMDFPHARTHKHRNKHSL